MSLRETILQADDLQSEPVDIPIWGVTVEVRGMDGHGRGAFIQSFSNSDGNIDWGQAIADLVIETCYDPATGQKVFQPSDREALLGKNGAALQDVAEAAMRLSGLTEKAQDEAGKDSGESHTDEPSMS